MFGQPGALARRVGSDAVLTRAALAIRGGGRKRLITQEKIVFAIFVLLFLGFSLFLPGFLTANNVALLLQSVSVLGILSVAMGATIIAGAIDLSMVALMAMSVAWALQLINNGMPVPLAMLIGGGAAILVGIINGMLVAYVEIPPLFATLGDRGLHLRVRPLRADQPGHRLSAEESRLDRRARQGASLWPADAGHRLRGDGRGGSR